MAERVSIGGQAVIEGVMMRSPEWLATAVRKPSGEIVYKKIKVGGKRNKLAKIPFVRGAVTLFDALVLGKNFSCFVHFLQTSQKRKKKSSFHKKKQ